MVYKLMMCAFRNDFKNQAQEFNHKIKNESELNCRQKDEDM